MDPKEESQDQPPNLCTAGDAESNSAPIKLEKSAELKKSAKVEESDDTAAELSAAGNDSDMSKPPEVERDSRLASASAAGVSPGAEPTAKGAETMPAQATSEDDDEEGSSQGFSGKVDGLALPEFLQLLHFNRKTVVIELELEEEITGDHKAAIYMREGEIVHAAVGHLSGRPALRALMVSKSGSVSTRPLGVSEAEQGTLSTSFDALLLDVLREIDEAQNALDGGQAHASTKGATGATKQGESEQDEIFGLHPEFKPLPQDVVAAVAEDRSPTQVTPPPGPLPSESTRRAKRGATSPGIKTEDSFEAAFMATFESGEPPARAGYPPLLGKSPATALPAQVLGTLPSGEYSDPAILMAGTHEPTGMRPAGMLTPLPLPVGQETVPGRLTTILLSFAVALGMAVFGFGVYWAVHTVGGKKSRRDQLSRQAASAANPNSAAVASSTEVLVTTRPAELELVDADTGFSLGESPVRIALPASQNALRLKARIGDEFSRVMVVKAGQPTARFDLRRWVAASRARAGDHKARMVVRATTPRRRSARRGGQRRGSRRVAAPPVAKPALAANSNTEPASTEASAAASPQARKPSIETLDETKPAISTLAESEGLELRGQLDDNAPALSATLD